ncbi:MAG: universal stress protein [Hyphomonadaceae bacterium]
MGAIDYACALAILFEAKLTVSGSRIAIRAPQNWIIGTMMSTMARELQTITSAKTEALELHIKCEALLARIQVKVSHVAEHSPGGLVDTAWLARVGDLCILGLSQDSAEPRLHVEDWLSGAGRPCILYPDTSKQPFSADNILICWDFSQSAARTVVDALPFLHNAKRFRAAVFGGEMDIPIADHMTQFVAFLAEHGIAVETENVLICKRTIGGAILEHATATGTNRIVMGAFGHSRLRKFLLGVATSDLRNKSTIPLPKSH